MSTFAPQTPEPTVSPQAYAYYNCKLVQDLPFKGMEVLVLSLVYLFLIVNLTVTFLDVAAKQMWPDKFLNPIVKARIAAIQAQFKKLKPTSTKSSDEDTDEEEEGDEKPPTPTTMFDLDSGVNKPEHNDIPDYNRIVAQEPYIAGRGVDEDLIPMLANNNAFATVSSYCSCTVRGYAMLSSTLICAGMCLGFLWAHNALIDRKSNDFGGWLGFIGYCMIFFTGIIMCGPDDNAVHRKANICLFTNIPLKLKDKENPLLHMHVIGVGSFVLLPFLAHGYRAYAEGVGNFPNYTTALTMCAVQLGCALLFAAATLLKGKITGYDNVLGNKCEIIGEIILLFASFLAFIQYETYGSSLCGAWVNSFHGLLLFTLFFPFVFVTRSYCWDPNAFRTAPSVVLLKGSTPVATSGPVPMLGYNDENLDLPYVKAKEE